jgi:hypothetical protein
VGAAGDLNIANWRVITMTDYEWDMFLHNMAHWWFVHQSYVAEHVREYLLEIEGQRP